MLHVLTSNDTINMLLFLHTESFVSPCLSHKHSLVRLGMYVVLDFDIHFFILHFTQRKRNRLKLFFYKSYNYIHWLDFFKKSLIISFNY